MGLAISPTTLARLQADESAAKRIAALLHESLPPDETATAAFEDDDGRWRIEVHFREPPDEQGVRELVRLAAGDSAAADLTFDPLESKDWVKASLAGLKPVVAGRFFVHGSHDRGRIPGNAIGIEIEAALAFGTGHHGTTRGCLLALDYLARRQSRGPVLDIGTGTGVLAIAAARLWHDKALATDIDPKAVIAARGNVHFNRAGADVETICAAGATARRIRERGPYDLIFANILLGPLCKMSRPLTQQLSAGGYIILSGLLPSHAHSALSAYRAQGLALEKRFPLDGWMTLLLRKPPQKRKRPGKTGALAKRLYP